MAALGRSKIGSRTVGRTLATVIAAFAVLACTVGISSAATKSADVRPAARVASVLAVQTRVSNRATVSTSTFCTYASTTQKSNPSAAEADSAASLQADYNKLKVDEPKLLAIVPSQIKGDYQLLFNWINKFYAELAAVHFDFMKMTPASLSALSSSNEKALQSASEAIQAYVKKVCGVNG